MAETSSLRCSADEELVVTSTSLNGQPTPTGALPSLAVDLLLFDTPTTAAASRNRPRRDSAVAFSLFHLDDDCDEQQAQRFNEALISPSARGDAVPDMRSAFEETPGAGGDNLSFSAIGTTSFSAMMRQAARRRSSAGHLSSASASLTTEAGIHAPPALALSAAAERRVIDAFGGYVDTDFELLDDTAGLSTTPRPIAPIPSVTPTSDPFLASRAHYDQSGSAFFSRPGVGSGHAPIGVEELISSPTSRGVSSVINFGCRRSDGLPVAVKTLKPRMRAEARRELLVLEARRRFYEAHPNLGSSRSYLNKPATCDGLVAVIGWYQAVDTGSLAVVMERMAGSIESLLYGGAASQDPSSLAAEATRRRLPSRSARPVPQAVTSAAVCMMLRGLRHLHDDLLLVHRDIKPANLLYDALGTVKIADFGLARGVADDNNDGDSFVGTTLYMAPERLKGAPYSVECDVWSLGITVAEMLLGRHPLRQYIIAHSDGSGNDQDQERGSEATFWAMAQLFRLSEALDHAQPVVQSTVLEPLYDAGIDPIAISFVRRCLLPQQLRPSCAELARDPFLSPFRIEDDDEDLLSDNCPTFNYELARARFFSYCAVMLQQR